jgi:hypothetical protein
MKKTAILFGIIFFAARLMAQPGDPGGDPDVPISGIELLIGAGGIYGLRKMMQKNKNRQ